MTGNGHNRRADLVLNLCFHGIGTPRRTLEPDEDLIWVDQAQFEELLDVIDRYPSARLTFDDSNASDAALALPALRRRSLKATFFVISGRLDQPGSLTTRDVRTLVREGMTIGSHGVRHVPWRGVDDRELHSELVESAKVIASAAGQPVRQVAFPFGSYDRRVLSAVRGHGFSRAYTVDGGPARRDAWLQSRYTVRAADTPADIERLARSPGLGAVPGTVRAAKSLVKRWR
jgi:peptidoglycan/xylan/chitin deacetylase (PgdA/CDA1 family)